MLARCSSQPLAPRPARHTCKESCNQPKVHTPHPVHSANTWSDLVEQQTLQSCPMCLDCSHLPSYHALLQAYTRSSIQLPRPFGPMLPAPALPARSCQLYTTPILVCCRCTAFSAAAHYPYYMPVKSRPCYHCAHPHGRHGGYQLQLLQHLSCKPLFLTGSCLFEATHMTEVTSHSVWLRRAPAQH